MLNPSKSEFIIFSSRNNVTHTRDFSINLCGQQLKNTDVVRDLGVMVDASLTMNAHISKIRQQAFSYLRIISKVRRFLSKKHTAQLVDSLAISRVNSVRLFLLAYQRSNLLVYSQYLTMVFEL
jgi:hypothetical protein